MRGVKESGGRKMETAVLEQQLKINTIKRIIFKWRFSNALLFM